MKAGRQQRGSRFTLQAEGSVHAVVLSAMIADCVISNETVITSVFLLNFMFLLSDLPPLPAEVRDAIALMSVLAAKLSVHFLLGNLKQVVCNFS